MKTFLSVLVTFLAMSLMSLVSPVQAQGGSITVSPLHLDAAFEAGQKAEKEIVVKNINDQAFSIGLELADVEIDPATHNVRFLPPSSLKNSQRSLASWISPKTSMPFVLEPGEERAVTVQIAVPRGIESGDYYASLNFSFQPVEAGKVRMVQVKQSVGALLLASVSGIDGAEAELLQEVSFEVDSRGDETWVKASLQNAGLRYIQAKSQLKLSGGMGDVYYLKEGASQRIFPGEEVKYESSLPSHLLTEKPLMTLTYSLWDKDGQTKFYEKAISVREGQLNPAEREARLFDRGGAGWIVLGILSLLLILWFRHLRKS